MTRFSRTGWRSPGRDRTYPPTSADLVHTPELARRAQDGDDDAAEVLCGRYLPRLCRWASGRPSADAIRMATRRAVIRLAREMSHVAHQPRA